MNRILSTAGLFLALFLIIGSSGLASAATPAHIVNLPRVHAHLRNGTSSNWSGYAVETNLTNPQSNIVNEVQGQWTVPAISCTTATTYSSVWVGIDGYSDNTVEQTGTEQDCQRGKPVYYAWYELYPNWAYEVNLSVAPGNVIKADVKYTTTNEYTLTLVNVTTGKTYVTTQRLNRTLRQSAEWVIEAPSSYYSVLPLTNFGTVNMTNAETNFGGTLGTINKTIGSGVPTSTQAPWQNDPITMLTNSNIAKSTPSALSTDGSSFSTTWNHS